MFTELIAIGCKEAIALRRNRQTLQHVAHPLRLAHCLIVDRSICKKSQLLHATSPPVGVAPP
jgi:hypothetical protein